MGGPDNSLPGYRRHKRPLQITSSGLCACTNDTAWHPPKDVNRYGLRKVRNMPKPLRCAVVGCGVIAPTHVESYLKQEQVDVAWACDLVEDKARKLARKYGIPNVTVDYRVVMDDPQGDCVSACTDHGSHTPIVIAALEAGKHVLCENALAVHSIETEDTAVAALRFKNGALGTLEATSASHIDWEWTLSFHGRAGSIDLRNDKPLKVNFADKDLACRVESDLTPCRAGQKIAAGRGYDGLGHRSHWERRWVELNGA